MRRYTNVSSLVLKSLLTISPIVVGMSVRDFSFSFYSDGVYKCGNTSIGELNHAVLLIGYDTAGNWLFKNSWGTDWGIDGFGWVSANGDCGIKYWVYQVIERPIKLYGWRMVGMMVAVLVTILIGA